MSNDAKMFVLSHLLDKLAAQQSYMTQLRSQAAISSAVTGLVATFFGMLISQELEALQGDFWGAISVVGLIGIALFTAALGFSVCVVVRTYDFHFHFKADIMLSNLMTADAEQDFFRDYVKDGEWYFNDNEQLISKAQSLLFAAMLCSFSQVIPWSIVLMEVLANE